MFKLFLFLVPDFPRCAAPYIILTAEAQRGQGRILNLHLFAFIGSFLCIPEFEKKSNG